MKEAGVSVAAPSSMPIPDWRDEASYAYLPPVDRRGFAWEWLRRNREYHARFAERPPIKGEMMERIAVIRAKQDDDASRWGLLFRRIAKPARHRRTPLLG